jgi:hypothetical protein
MISKLSILFLLFGLFFVNALYFIKETENKNMNKKYHYGKNNFRKEHILQAREFKSLVDDDDYGDIKNIVELKTIEGNTYFISNNAEGIKITDSDSTNNFNYENTINLRGYKTIGEILDKIEKLNTEKKLIDENKFKKNEEKYKSIQYVKNLRRAMET